MDDLTNCNFKLDEEFKNYFDEEKWDTFSVYERQRFMNIKRNYEVLKSLDLNPKMPQFMVPRKKAEVNPSLTSWAKKDLDALLTSIDRNSRKKEEWKKLLEMDWENPEAKLISKEKKVFSYLLEEAQNYLEQLNEIMVNLKSETSDSEQEPDDKECELYIRCPKRNVAKLCCEEAEQETSSEDDRLFCEDCGEEFEEECPVHGPLIHVRDQKVPLGSDPDRAQQTCPPFLSVCHSAIKGAGLGIWAEIPLPKGIVFGPYEGKIVTKHEEVKNTGYAWEVRRKGMIQHYVEASDPSVSNWLRFVNCAPYEERQNLVAFQYDGNIYYKTYKRIIPGTELLVWYGEHFAEDLGINRSHDPGEIKNCKGNSDSLLKAERFISCRGRHSYMQFTKKRISKDGMQQKKLQSKVLEIKDETIDSVELKPSQTVKQPVHNIEEENAHDKETNRIPRNRHSRQLNHPVKGFSSTSRENCSGRLPLEGKDRKEANEQHKRRHCQFSTIRCLSNMRKCPHCEYRTLNSGHLREHVSAVHDRIKPHKCPYCKYRTVRARYLKNHVNSVHDSKKTRRAGHLRQQMQAAHDGVKLHECPHCEYRTMNVCNVREHISAVHYGMKPHKCPHCPYRTARARYLSSHVNAKHGGSLKSRKCPHCCHRTTQAIHLREHVKAVHDRIRSHKCPYCKYRTSRARDIPRHVNEVHHNEKPQHCLYCEYRTSRAHDLQKHVNAVHDGIRLHKGSHCDSRASSSGTHQNNKSAKHDGLRPHKCPHCTYRGSHFSRLREHISAVHDGIRPHKCPHCEYRTARARYLKSHIKRLHRQCRTKKHAGRPLGEHLHAVSEGAELHKCLHCQYRTTRACDLRKHVSVIHDGKRSHKCSSCGYRTTRACDLQKHVRAVHGEARPYKCRNCEFRARESTRLEKHVSAVHGRVRPHKCPQCEYRTAYPTLVKNHIRAVHDGIRPHKCQNCNYRAADTTRLKKHVSVVHDKVKPQKCPHCGYRTTYPSKLQRHVTSLHERVRAHVCPHCQYKSSRYDNLQNHLSTVHAMGCTHVLAGIVNTGQHRNHGSRSPPNEWAFI